MRTYYKAELYKDNDLDKADFPERQTEEEAIADACNALSSLSDRERVGIEACVILWRDDDGCITNQGYRIVDPPACACD